MSLPLPHPWDDLFARLKKRKEYLKLRSEKNKEQRAKQRKENNEHIREVNRIWYQKNKEKIAEKRKNSTKQKEYQKSWYEADKERILARMKKYNETNKERIKIIAQRYYQKNKAVISEKARLKKIALRESSTVENPAGMKITTKEPSKQTITDKAILKLMEQIKVKKNGR